MFCVRINGGESYYGPIADQIHLVEYLCEMGWTRNNHEQREWRRVDGGVGLAEIVPEPILHPLAMLPRGK